MFNRFTKGAGKLLSDAVDLAHDLGSPTVEAEHLLLAAVRRDDAAAVVLRGHGLDYDRLEAALTAETERSLAAVGVTATTPRTASPRSSRCGASPSSSRPPRSSTRCAPAGAGRRLPRRSASPARRSTRSTPSG